jgi:hypothetical protein
MATAEKKKKSKIRIVLKWSGISFLVVLIGLITVPIVFKDKIKDLVIQEVNKSLTAELSLGKFDLTFISTFPNMTIQLDDAKITGKNEFEGLDLMDVKQFRAHVKFWSIVSGDQVEIDEIHLIQPNFNVKVLKNGLANYDIVKPDSVKTEEEISEPSNFKLSLKEYSISNANTTYDDQQGNMYAKLMNLSHQGTGDLTADVIDFKTSTTMDELTYDMDGVSYFSKVKTEAIANILMEFTEKTSKFTFKENKFMFNALTFSIDGFYEMLDGYDNMDIKLDASKATFKDFLSLIPTFYQSGYESMITNGSLAMNGFVKGRMDDKNMPGWDFNLSVSKASIKYPDLPGTINNIELKAGSTFSGGEDLDKMTLDIPKFHAEFAGNLLDATLKMRNPMTDPLIDSKIMAKVDLASLGKVLPMTEGESYTGKLDADILLNGRLSSIENERYEEFKADGTLKLMDMVYKSADLPDEVAINSMLFLFSPKNLSLVSLEAKMGKSDFQMDGKIDNYLGYVFRDELLLGSFNFNSTNLDLDELMGTSEPTSTNSSEPTPAETSDEAILIPGNIDFKLNSKIGNMRYNAIDIKNVNGLVHMKDEVASLDNLTMNAMGGSIGLKGSFDTRNHDKPFLDFGYDLKGIDIQELVKNFVTIEKLAPIAKSAQGKITSTFTMKAGLTPNLDPIYNTLNGQGDLFTNLVTISGFKPLEKMSEVLKMDQLKSQTIKDLKAKFKFADGKVTVTPFDVKLGKIVTTISGSTSFEQDIDYVLKMNIPKEEIPASMIKLVEDQVKKVNALAPKLDIKVIPDNIPVNVKVLGKTTDPKVTTDFKEALLGATGNLKDNLKNTAKELVNTAKDSVKTIIKDKVEDVKEDLIAKKQQLMDDAQKQADKVKGEAKKAANLVRSEGDKQANALMSEAGNNPIKKKAAELSGNKIKKEAEEKAQKIEKEGDTKADAIMNAATAKADQIK